MAKHVNNFDLIRLAAASQVMVLHVIDTLDVESLTPLRVLRSVLAFFPGVPIFFVISGYLVSTSYERSRSLADYARNRVLRIYPALVVCTLLTLVAFLVLHRPVDSRSSTVLLLGKWLLAQLTIFQFYVPYPLKAAYGVGHWNGSLWTIPVELQFYAVLPLIYLAIAKLKARADWLLVALLVASYLASLTLDRGVQVQGTAWEGTFAIWRTSVPAYLWMFLLGVFAQRYRQAIARWLSGKALTWLAIYLSGSIAFSAFAGVPPGTNHPHPLEMLLLAALTLSAANTMPTLANRLLGGNDISYGVYIYHSVVVNVLWELGYVGTGIVALASIALTYVAAFLSWTVVERRALTLKPAVSAIAMPPRSDGSPHTSDATAKRALRR
jgi:peptidoglycan/LPS O-acetylase OafA/YrhL